MSIMATTLTLLLLTLGAGYLLWCLGLHYEEFHTPEESEVSHGRRSAALLFLTIASLFIVGTLGVLLVEVQQLLMSKSS